MTTALVLAAPRCPACGGPLHVITAEQLPLLIHGGYGGTAVYVYDVCGTCGTTRLTATGTGRPPR